MEKKAKSLCKLNLVAQKRVAMKTWDEVLFDERKKLGLKTAEVEDERLKNDDDDDDDDDDDFIIQQVFELHLHTSNTF